MTLAELRREAEIVRAAFKTAVDSGKDGRALVARFENLQKQISERVTSATNSIK